MSLSHTNDRDNLWTPIWPLSWDLTVAAVIPGKSLSRPTFLFSSVQTWNLAVVLALHTVSQLTEDNMDKPD